jgi:hypothetical protein
VRAVAIVVINERGEDALQMLPVQYQEPVETYLADSPHEPLGDTVGLRGSKWRANDLDVFASKHVVKTTGELLVPVANQTADGLRATA